jgi:hypothetical protein
MADLPAGDEALAEWCKARFAEKEASLKELYGRAAAGMDCSGCRVLVYFIAAHRKWSCRRG